MSLNADELSIIDALVKKLRHHDIKNSELEAYYEGKNRIKDLGISIPPQLKCVDAVVGWAGTAIDVLEERLDFQGWQGGDAFGLDKIYNANQLDLESGLGHKDALIYGTGFVVVGKGGPGEPDPLITVESAKKMTGIYDMRARRLAAALMVNRDHKGQPLTGSLYLPNETIYLQCVDKNWFEIDRDVHMLGVVPVVPLVNNPRSGDPEGSSEITKALRSYTDSAMRTLLGAEVAREFYSSPQRYVLGADEEVFLDADGNKINPWTAIQGRIMALPYNEENNVTPTVGQFSANSPAPYFDAIRSYAQLVAAETAIPASYLGFQTDNPSSADAIRQMEARLIKRAERRQKQFGRTWIEVAKIALLIRDGVVPADIDSVRPMWSDAATPTRAAAADEAIKLIQAGVLLPDSEVTYNRIGLTEVDKEILKKEKDVAKATSLIGNLAAAAQAAQQNPTVSQLSAVRGNVA